MRVRVSLWVLRLLNSITKAAVKVCVLPGAFPGRVEVTPVRWW